MDEIDRIAKNRWLSNEAKFLLLVHKGHSRFIDLNKAGLSSSVIYRIGQRLILDGFVVYKNKQYELTEKGREMALRLEACVS